MDGCGRIAEIERNTAETQVQIRLGLDGGRVCVDSGVGFLNHMLTLFAAHGRFGLEVRCKGDTDVDDHHSVEDVGIALGQAFAAALGEKRGIRRYGSCILPMDEALILTAADFSAANARIALETSRTFLASPPHSADR